MQNKTDAVPTIKMFISLIENQFEIHIKTLRSDNGGEFFNNQLRDFF